MYSIKYDLLNRPLELKKTHDVCVSGKPRLTVVCLHGIASDSSAFKNTLKYLEGTTSMQDVRFVAFDLLGAGDSYKSGRLKYNYKEQLEALENSLAKLKIKTPLVILGHSMGTLIATRYASTHKKAVKKLVLVSPPMYSEKDLDDPAFPIAMQSFKEAVSMKNRAILEDPMFNNSIKYIVTDRKNYKTLETLTTHAVLIYSELDQIIAPYNANKLLKANSKYLTAVKAPGRHGMSREKYGKILTVLEEILHETV